MTSTIQGGLSRDTLGGGGGHSGTTCVSQRHILTCRQEPSTNILSGAASVSNVSCPSVVYRRFLGVSEGHGTRRVSWSRFMNKKGRSEPRAAQRFLLCLLAWFLLGPGSECCLPVCQCPKLPDTAVLHPSLFQGSLTCTKCLNTCNLIHSSQQPCE